MVGFQVQMQGRSTFLYVVGNGDFLGAFFDTVALRLENGRRGKRFPVFNMLYQGLGFKGQATLLASCRQGIFFLPAVFLLPLAFGCLGVQAAQPVADLCTFAVALPFAIAFYRRYVRGQSDAPTV